MLNVKRLMLNVKLKYSLKSISMKHLFALILSVLIYASAAAAQVDTLDIFSPSMYKTSRCIVILPENYTIKGDKYPVLYLLHGWSGSYAGWLGEAPQLKKHADQYQMIIVCPDGGYDSWYLDSPVDSTVRYDTYISKELVAYIDYYYHTQPEKSGRAIAGLSMGGHGAITLAAKHPDVFGAAGSRCGGLDLRPFKKNDWDLEGVLGKPSQNWDNWETVSAINMVPMLQKSAIPLIIDCGTGDFFLEVNRAMHQSLLEAKVAHEYTERPGEHNRDYWSNAVDFQVLFFDKFFRQQK
jgi:S-formylglutathione hydrolase FrmB